MRAQKPILIDRFIFICYPIIEARQNADSIDSEILGKPRQSICHKNHSRSEYSKKQLKEIIGIVASRHTFKYSANGVNIVRQ